MNTHVFRKVPVPAALLLVATCAPADEMTADVMRCGENLVNIGATEYEVITNCGEPLYKEEDRWTYDPGEGSFLYILSFGNGTLQNIDLGPREEK
jgi:hypothetical protein